MAAAAQAQVEVQPLPTRLACRIGEHLGAHLSRDGDGRPLGAGVWATSGTHECDVQAQGPATATTDGGWRFEWTDPVQRLMHYRLTVKPAGAAGHSLTLEPPRCGTLALPAIVTLPARDKACESGIDRDAAFVLFWRQLREAIARRDGERLQRLALPQPLFAEGPDLVKAPAALLRHAAPCLAGVTTTDGRTDLGRLLQATDTPRLDMPPLSRRGDARVSLGGAAAVLWTPQGWRLESFNADRASFSACRPGLTN